MFMLTLLYVLLINPSFCFDIHFNTKIDPKVDKSISVEAEIKNWKNDELIIKFPDRWGPADKLYKNIVDLKVYINDKETKTRFLLPKDDSDYARYFVNNGTKG